ncbi:hypothetical protein JXB31_04850 [Candidatus Woesearchaeota archaeon]|nr:hypothetical protein [Candidatus Woesearchaeota archaeon]
MTNAIRMTNAAGSAKPARMADAARMANPAGINGIGSTALALLYVIMLILSVAPVVAPDEFDPNDPSAWQDITDPALVTQYPVQYGNFISENPDSVKDCPDCYLEFVKSNPSKVSDCLKCYENYIGKDNHKVLSCIDCYSKYLATDPANVLKCKECYRTYLSADPANVKNCIECYRLAITDDNTLLQNNTAAFVVFAKNSGHKVNFEGVDSSIVSYKDGVFSTKKSSFTLEDLGKIQSNLKLDGFRIDASGSIELLQGGNPAHILQGTIGLDAYGDLTLSGEGAIYQGGLTGSIQSLPIRLASDSVFRINKDGKVDLVGDGAINVNGKVYEISNWKNIHYTELKLPDGKTVYSLNGEIQDNLAFVFQDAEFENMHAYAPALVQVFFDPEHNNMPNIAATEDIIVSGNTFDALFKSDKTTKNNLFIHSAGVLSEFRGSGSIRFDDDNGQYLLTLNNGIVATEDGSYVAKENTFNMGQEKGTFFIDSEGESMLAEYDSEICNSYECVTNSNYECIYARDSETGEIFEWGDGIHLDPFMQETTDEEVKQLYEEDQQYWINTMMCPAGLGSHLTGDAISRITGNAMAQACSVVETARLMLSMKKLVEEPVKEPAGYSYTIFYKEADGVNKGDWVKKSGVIGVEISGIDNQMFYDKEDGSFYELVDDEIIVHTDFEVEDSLEDVLSVDNNGNRFVKDPGVLYPVKDEYGNIIDTVSTTFRYPEHDYTNSYAVAGGDGEGDGDADSGIEASEIPQGYLSTAYNSVISTIKSTVNSINAELGNNDGRAIGAGIVITEAKMGLAKGLSLEDTADLIRANHEGIDEDLLSAIMASVAPLEQPSLEQP